MWFYWRGDPKVKESFYPRYGKKYFELDLKLFKNKKPEYLSLGFRHRIIWSKNGDMKLNRRRYVNKKTGKYHYLLDEHLGLEPRKYVVGSYRKLASKLFSEFKSYKDIAKNVFNGDVTKQAVYSFIKENNVSFDNELE